MPHSFLPFIEDEAIKCCVKTVLEKAEAARASKAEDVFKNAIDPFSAVIDASVQSISLSSWLEQEKSRQAQKTMQNAVGEFHQQVLGSVPGWKSLPVGAVIDVINEEKKIIAEVKNKYNTTKGNHRVTYYDDFQKLLAKEYQGFTAYYVEIIPKNRKTYNKEFTPSESGKGKRAANKFIRIIDGQAFYKLVTDSPTALHDLYKVLPKVIATIPGFSSIEPNDPLLPELFGKTY